MIYYIAFCVVVLILIALVIWFTSPRFKSIPDASILLLDGDNDEIVSHWYQANAKAQVLDGDADSGVIASELIRELFDIDVDPETIVVGHNLRAQYRALSTQPLLQKYDPDAECILDLRSLIGKPGDILITHDPMIKRALWAKNEYDMTPIRVLMKSGLTTTAYQYLQTLLEHRWNLIS